MKRMTFIAIICVLVLGFFSPRLSTSSNEADKDNNEVQEAYRAYVAAWKVKDTTALKNLISDRYMAVNFEGKVSDKNNEITTAQEDPEWISMTVDEIHTREFGNTAIASGFISAQGKKKDGSIFSAKVRFLAALVKRDRIWQLVATQSTSFKPVLPSPKQGHD